MTPDKSLQNLFNAALERQDPTERARFLLECGADAVLRERVERLLRAADEIGDFMAQPSRKPVGLDSDPPRPGGTPLTEKPGIRLVAINCSNKSGKAVAAWFTWPSRRNRCAGAWRSRSSSWAWTQSRSLPASRPNGRPWR